MEVPSQSPSPAPPRDAEPTLRPSLAVSALWLGDQHPGLFVRTAVPSAAWATVVFLHGSMVHSEYYLPTAVALGVRGVASLWPDLRGHGRSEGRRGHIGDVADHLDDALRTLRRAAALLPGLPLAVGGESYGGLVAWLAAPRGTDPAVRAVVLSAPAFALRAKADKAQMRWLTRVARIAPRAYLPVRLSLTGVSRHPDLDVLSERDPLIVHQYTVGFYLRLLAAQEAAQRAAAEPSRLPPVLGLLGGRDTVTDNTVTRTLLARVPQARMALYPDALHAVLADDPERTADDIAAFLASVLP